MTPAVFQQKHEAWLQCLFTSFMISDEKLKSELYDLSQILFRHMRWIARELQQEGQDYAYDRSRGLHTFDTVSDALEALSVSLRDLIQTYPDTPLSSRMATDENYILSRLSLWRDQAESFADITAFNRHRTLPGKSLDRSQTDALTLFLFEESYKEYELILIYAYMQNKSQNLDERDIYQDLIDESHFHLKSFGNLMAQMGILALPRPLHEHTYRIEDVEAFIRAGITEEENAKEQCRSLAEAVKDEELSVFFDFINYQESYHIELMRKLLNQSFPK